MLVVLFSMFCANKSDRKNDSASIRRDAKAISIVIEDVLITDNIDEGSLQHKSPQQLRIIRNAIFAQYGYVFKNKELDRYFRQFNWYNPRFDDVDALLTSQDKKNLELLSRYESIKSDDSAILSRLNQSSRRRLGNFEFPLVLQDFINTFGAPNRMEVGGDDNSSIGQINTWFFDDLNVKLIVLGDRYDNKSDYSSGVRYFSIHKIDHLKPTRYEGFMGIELGWSAAMVTKRIDEFVDANKSYRTYRSNQGVPLYNYFREGGAGQVTQIILTDGGIYFYFVFDQNNELRFIAQSNFNMMTAG